MKNVLRSLGAATLAVATLLTSASVAHADTGLAPDRGPVTGGTIVSIEAPQAPQGVTFLSVAAGANHSLAIGDDGNTYAWGDNGQGALGDGTKVSRVTPVLVHVPEGVAFVRIDAGDVHSMALGNDGNYYAWGGNRRGQLGNGTTNESLVPVRVQVPTGVIFTSTSTGGSHTLALGDDGNAYSWGANSSGQLGDGLTVDRLTPGLVQKLEDTSFTSVAAGRNHSLAIADDGASYAWGGNEYGQLGDSSTKDRLLLVRIHSPQRIQFRDVAAGAFHSHAIGEDGQVYAWGANGYGQLGDNSSTDRVTPVVGKVPPGVSFVGFSVGRNSTFATGDDGNLYGWGYNGNGQLGIGSRTNHAAPVMIQEPSSVPFAQLSSGEGHSVAVDSDGHVSAWGSNVFGQAGDGTQNDHDAPVEVVSPNVRVTGVSFGEVLGTKLTKRPNGTWAVTTPEHEAGEVDVEVQWTFGGLTQTPVIHPGGFSYDPLPVGPGITNPSDQLVVSGDEASFEVSVTGTPQPTVSWEVLLADEVEWSPIAADSAATVMDDGLAIAVLASLDHHGNRYRATAVNSEGSLTSEPALLSVAPVPEAPTVTNPGSQSVVEGEPAMFAVTVTGAPKPNVTWELSRDAGSTWDSIESDDSASVSTDELELTVIASLNHNGFLYRVHAENSAGAAVSDPAGLVVTPVPTAPTITDPESRHVAAGDAALFSVAVTGTPEPAVAWQVSRDAGEVWEMIDIDRAATVSEDGLTVTVVASSEHDGVQYRAIAVNSEGSEVSKPATLTVKESSNPDDGDDDSGDSGSDSDSGGGSGGSKLPTTGGDRSPVMAVSALGLLLLGSGGLIAARWVRKSRSKA